MQLASVVFGLEASPEFESVTLSDLTASRLVWTDSSKGLASKDLVDLVAGTANEINVTDDTNGGIIIGLVDPLIVAKGGTGVATLTDHGILLGSGTDAVTILGAAANGQIPIGSVGADPVLATLTGTANQVTVTNAAGSITLSLPHIIIASNNTGVGFNALNSLTTGNNNTGIGYDTLTALTEGSLNTAIGEKAGNLLTSGNSNVLLGYKAGSYQTTNSNLLIIDNQVRTNVATEITNCLIYGVFNATPASQTLRLNGVITASQGVTINNISGSDALTIYSATPPGGGKVCDFSTGSDNLWMNFQAGTAQAIFYVDRDTAAGFGTLTEHPFYIRTNNTNRIALSGDGTTLAYTGTMNVTGTVAATTVTGANVTTGADPGHTHTAYQAADADLTAIAALSSADSNFIVGSAAGWVVESGATARTSIGLGTGDSPTFTGDVVITAAGGGNAGGAQSLQLVCTGQNGTVGEGVYIGFTDSDGGNMLGKIRQLASAAGNFGFQFDTWSGGARVGVMKLGSTGVLTLTNNIVMADGKTIGQAAGPLLAFDDTNNYLEITGCSVGIGTTAPNAMLDVEGNIYPHTDNTYYLGKNDDDAPFAWKGVILKDTTDGKYYRVEVINGVVTATDLTD